MESPLLDERGRLRVGFFDEPIGEIDPLAFELRSPLGEVLDAGERAAEFRQFQFLGAIADDLVVGCALTKSGLLQSGFAYVCRPSDNQLIQLRLRVGPDGELRLTRDPDHGESVLRSAKGTVTMSAAGAVKQLRIESDVMNIDLALDESGFETQRICTRAGPTGFSYAQKVAGVAATGTVSCELGPFDLGALGAGGHHDFTAGFLRPETWWHWACLSAMLPDGRRIGLNLSCGTNETSYTENCLWVDGLRHRVAGTVFDFDPDDWDAPWSIRTVDGTAELRFRPAHGYHATGDGGQVATNFHQLFGTFEGYLLAPDGSRIELHKLPGFAESQYLRW